MPRTGPSAKVCIRKQAPPAGPRAAKRRIGRAPAQPQRHVAQPPQPPSDAPEPRALGVEGRREARTAPPLRRRLLVLTQRAMQRAPAAHERHHHPSKRIVAHDGPLPEAARHKPPKQTRMHGLGRAGPRVAERQRSDARGLPGGKGAADGSAPIMGHKREPLDVQMLQEGRQVRGVRCRTKRRRRMGGAPEADPCGGDAAPVRCEPGDDRLPERGRRGVAVQQHHRGPGADVGIREGAGGGGEMLHGEPWRVVRPAPSDIEWAAVG